MLIFHLPLEMYYLVYKSYSKKQIDARLCCTPRSGLSLSLSLSLSYSLMPFILRVPLDPAGAGPWHQSL